MFLTHPSVMVFILSSLTTSLKLLNRILCNFVINVDIYCTYMYAYSQEILFLFCSEITFHFGAT